MPDKIPIKFNYKAKEYEGYFVPVMGAGSTAHFHLMINNFYLGQLFQTSHGWEFFGNNFEGMGEYFGNYIELWYE